MYRESVRQVHSFGFQHRLINDARPAIVSLTVLDRERACELAFASFYRLFGF